MPRDERIEDPLRAGLGRGDGSRLPGYAAVEIFNADAFDQGPKASLVCHLSTLAVFTAWTG